MKVLQINSFFIVGGPPRIVNGIYDTLIEEGHECKIAAARENEYVAEDSIRIGSRFNVYYNAILSRVFDNEGFSAKHATKELIKQIDEYNPDVIHLHNLHGYYINVEILFDYLKKSGKPVVWTLHDCWSMTGHCAHFDAIGCMRWKNEGCHNCPQKSTYPSSFCFDKSKSNYIRKKKAFLSLDNLTFATPSKWLAFFLQQSFLKKYPVKVIHNGIDLEKIRISNNQFKNNYNLEHKKIILGVAQVWGEKKGFNDFIKLAGKLDDRYKVVMVGLSQKELVSLPDNVLGIARTNNFSELVEIYSSADVFVNLTYEDNFPTVNIEALACGVPVITYKTGGSPEAIDDTCGWVVEQGNLDAVIRVIENIQSKDSYTQSCLDRAKLFDRKARYQEYVELYKQIVGR